MRRRLTGPLPRWWSTNNHMVGFQHHSTESAAGLWQFLAEQTAKHRSTIRVWHTRRLVIIWETEHRQTEPGVDVEHR